VTHPGKKRDIFVTCPMKKETANSAFVTVHSQFDALSRIRQRLLHYTNDLNISDYVTSSRNQSTRREKDVGQTSKCSQHAIYFSRLCRQHRRCIATIPVLEYNQVNEAISTISKSDFSNVHQLPPRLIIGKN